MAIALLWLFFHKPDNGCIKDSQSVIQQKSTNLLWEESLIEFHDEQSQLTKQIMLDNKERAKHYNRNGRYILSE